MKMKDWGIWIGVFVIAVAGAVAFWSSNQFGRGDQKAMDERTVARVEERRSAATLTLLTIEEARALQKSGKALFLDARSDREYQYAHIPNAISAYYQDVKTNPKILSLDRSQPVVAYCNSPKCPMAEVLATKLNELGFTRIYVFPGGMKEWIGAKLPIQAAEVLQ